MRRRKVALRMISAAVLNMSQFYEALELDFDNPDRKSTAQKKIAASYGRKTWMRRNVTLRLISGWRKPSYGRKTWKNTKALKDGKKKYNFWVERIFVWKEDAEEYHIKWNI